jgi:hypothetical protein
MPIPFECLGWAVAIIGKINNTKSNLFDLKTIRKTLQKSNNYHIKQQAILLIINFKGGGKSNSLLLPTGNSTSKGKIPL